MSQEDGAQGLGLGLRIEGLGEAHRKAGHDLIQFQALDGLCTLRLCLLPPPVHSASLAQNLVYLPAVIFLHPSQLSIGCPSSLVMDLQKSRSPEY